MPTYDRQLEVHRNGEGYEETLRRPLNHPTQLYSWFFNMRIVIYRYQTYKVDGARVQVPPPVHDPVHNVYWHSNREPPMGVYKEDGEDWVQRRVSIWELTEKSFKHAFEGYNRYRETSHHIPTQWEANTGTWTNPEMERNLKRVYPIYTMSKEQFEALSPEEQNGIAYDMAEEFLKSMYTRHYLMEVVRFSGIVTDTTKTYNDIPLFNNRRRFANVMFDGLDFGENHTEKDQIDGHCVLKIIHDKFIDTDDEFSNRRGYKNKAQHFVGAMGQRPGGWVTLGEFNKFIESLESVSLMVFGPLDQLIYQYEAPDRQNLLVCRLEDNHLFLLDEEYNNCLSKKRDIQLGDPNVLLKILKKQSEPKFHWGKEIFTDNPSEDIFKGTNQFYCIDEHQFDNCSGGIGMARLLNRVMYQTNTKVHKIGWGKKGPKIFQIPGSGNMVVCEPDIHDRRDLMRYLKQQYENELPALHEKCQDGKKAFEWDGQSYMQISRLIFHAMGNHTSLLASNLRPEHYVLLTELFKVAPMQDKCISEVQHCNALEDPTVRTFDCVRNYTWILYNNKYGWNIFDEFTEVIDFTEEESSVLTPEDIKPGEYRIRGDFYMENMTPFKIREGLYPFDFVRVCLERRYIKPEQIVQYMRANHHLPGGYFREFVEFVYQLPDNGPRQCRHKNLINFFIGNMGRFKDRTTYNMVTDNPDVVHATINAFGEENVTWYNLEEKLIPGEDDLQLVRINQDKDLLRTAYPMVRQIYCMSWIKLADIWRSVMKLGTQLLSFKCDAITVRHAKEQIELVNSKRLEDAGKIHEEEGHVHNSAQELRFITPEKHARLTDAMERGLKHRRPHWKPVITRHPDETDDQLAQHILGLDGCLITGPGGSGKSTLIAKLIKNTVNRHLVLCFQNIACVKIRNETGSPHVHTFDSFFQNYGLETLDYDGKGRDRLEELGRVNLVIVDEYTQTPPDKLKMLYHAQRKCKGFMKVVLAGDHNQTQYIGPENRFRVNYTNCDMVKLLCGGNICKLDYIDGVTRCDRPLRAALDELIETRKIPTVLRSEDYRVNLDDEPGAFTITKYRGENRGKNTVNNVLSRSFPDFKKTVVGARVIASKNEKGKKNEQGELENSFFNGETYVVQSIDEKTVELIGILGTYGKSIIITRRMYEGRTDGKENFEQFHAQSVYRVQGMTLEPGITPLVHVHMHGLSFEEVYTALSRCRNLSQLRITANVSQLSGWGSLSGFPNTKYGTESIEITRTSQFPIKGKIYQIIDKRLIGPYNIVYVGRTKRTVKQEFEDILRDSKRPGNKRAISVYIQAARGDHHFDVKQIDKLNCHTMDRLDDLETEWIQRRKAEGHPLKNEKKIEEDETEPILDDFDWVTPVINTRNNRSMGHYNDYLENSILRWNISSYHIKTRDILRLRATHHLTKEHEHVEMRQSTKRAREAFDTALENLKTKVRKRCEEAMFEDEHADRVFRQITQSHC